MISLSKFEFIELYWFRSDNLGRNLTLKFDEDVLGSITFPNIFTYKAHGETADGSWRFSRKGNFKIYIYIYRKDEKKSFLKFQYKLNRRNKTEITFPSLNSYEWRIVDKMGTYGWFFNDELVFEFKIVVSLSKKQMKVSFKKSDLPESERSILLLAGTYLVVVIQ